MTLEPYDIKQDDKATELRFQDCPAYYCPRGHDVGKCRLDDKTCSQEICPPCPVLEEILEEKNNV